MQNKEDSVEELSQETKVVEIIRDTVEEKSAKTENEKSQNEITENRKENEKLKEEKQEEKFKKTEKFSKKDAEHMDNIPRKKWVKPVIISSVIILILLIFSMIFAIFNINSDKIISGISINNVEVSGLTKEEAKGKLETIVNEKKAKEITIKCQDFETQVSPELIEANYDLDNAVEQAFNVGRDGNIFGNNYSILFTMIGKKNIDINISLNEEVLNKTVKDAGTNLPGAMKESSYYIENDNLIVTKGTKGFAIDFEEAKTKIKEALKEINSNNKNFIELKAIEKEPEPINLDKIYEEVHKEAKDAYYTKDPFQIFPEVNGVDFNLEEAKAQLAEDKEEYTIKLTITKPKVTIDEIGTEAFPDRLSIFTTRYNAADTNRTTNLRLACEKINGKVLMPGETFSYNKTLGERTIAAGYRNAKVYENGQVVDGIGGGICQISSTLYNAVLMANLEVTDRTNHQFVTSYLPAGRDATVVYGLTDFQFKNTRKTPVKINAGINGGIATISVFGMKDENDTTVTFETRTIATLPVTVKYVDDASLAPGQEVVKQAGHTGVQTETYIIKSKDGKVVSKSLLSKDTYNAMQKIINRGVGVAPAPAQPAAPAAPTVPTTTETQANPAPQAPQPEKPVAQPTPSENAEQPQV